MTDELDQAATAEPEVGEAVADFSEGMVSADASMAASLPSIDDINVENTVKAVKWGWNKLPGHGDRVVPTAPDLDLPPDEEETTMRSTWVVHDDPPPPPPPEPQHEPEHQGG